MRKEIYRQSRDLGLALLERAPAVHLATTDETGAPILRVVHTVVDDGHLAFHGAPAGEKMRGIGRLAVASAHEIVASIPSYFVDPARACPVTTFYESVQLHGVIEAVASTEVKARVLAALTRKYQPEGRGATGDLTSPAYEKEVLGVLVARISLEYLDAKSKLGQNRPPAERAAILERLWERGFGGDPRAIELVRGASPHTPTPRFLEGPRDIALACWLDERDVAEGAALLRRHAYWLEGTPTDAIVKAFGLSAASVGARDPSGHVVGVGRATSDGRTAWIYDLCVDEPWRGRMVGQSLMRLLLDHPALRHARHVRLTTRDAQTLYERLGFRDLAQAPRHSWTSTEMILSRT